MYEIDGWTAPILDGTWHGASLDAMMRSLQVVHPETNEVLGRLVGEGAEGKNHVPEHSRVGVIWAKGPQITKGYYRSGLTSLHLYQVTWCKSLGKSFSTKYFAFELAGQKTKRSNFLLH